MDFNRLTETAETFDPDSRVVRSSQTVQQDSQSKDPKNSAAVSVGNALPANIVGDFDKDGVVDLLFHFVTLRSRMQRSHDDAGLEAVALEGDGGEEREVGGVLPGARHES